eukprot:103196-Prorocentrum_minimum.AAC.1
MMRASCRLAISYTYLLTTLSVRSKPASTRDTETARADQQYQVAINVTYQLNRLAVAGLTLIPPCGPFGLCLKK